MVNVMNRLFGILGFRLVSIFVVGLPFFAAAQNPVARPLKFATDYNWSMNPAQELGQPGSKTVNLATCPPGVKGNEPEYWILINGSEINGSEAAKVTGGTCAGDGRPGTLLFVTRHAHAGAAEQSTLSSASSGLQEALIAARYAPPTRPALRNPARWSCRPGN
jgi:hypothetical protein